MTTTLDDALSKRNIALIALDIEWAKENMPKASNPDVYLAAMHKARYDCIHIPRDLRMASYKYLKLHHHKRMTGDDLLPEGELPT